jgi:hypothetical protein
MSRAGIRVWAIAAIGALFAGACGAGSTDGSHTSASAGSTELGSPPFPPGPASALQSVAQRWLVVVDGRSVAAYDFSQARWAKLPDSPQAPDAVMAVGSSVVLLGARCGAECARDEKHPVVAARYDLADQASAWQVKELAVPAWEPKFLGVQVAGERDGRTIFAGFGSLYAMDADLTIRELPEPELPDQILSPWITCVVHDGLLALVTSPEHQGDELGLVSNLKVGTDGNLAVAATTRAGSPWSVAPRSDTTALTPRGQSASIVSRTCLPDGIMITSPAETFVWRSGSWTQFTPPPLFTAAASQSTTTASGTTVMPASGGRLSLWRDGHWSSVEAVAGVDPAGLAATSVVAIGDRVVVLSFDRPEARSRRLREVSL